MKEPLHGNSVLLAVLKANESRSPKRVRLKLKRMAEDSFSFFRGACPLFASAWAEFEPPDPGPEFLICGDLHLENFGAYRDDDGEFLFDVNDFDEALVAPCSIDPVRCATSILLAAELWGLSPLQANGMVLAYLDEYRVAVTTQVHPRLIDEASPRTSRGPVWDILGKTALGDQAAFLDRHTERLKDGTRRILRIKRKHPELSRKRFDEIEAAVNAYGKAQGEPGTYQLLDATGRIAGIGSLGLERYLILIAGGRSAETNRLLDIKEARPSAWIGHEGRSCSPPGSSEAARVVHAQRVLQAKPTAGLDVFPLDGGEYRLREMIPEENRSSLDRLQRKPGKLRQAIMTAGRLAGLSHLRGAQVNEGRDDRPALSAWATGPALDSVLAAAARHAEAARAAHKQFVAELKAPRSLPDEYRDRVET